MSYDQTFKQTNRDYYLIDIDNIGVLHYCFLYLKHGSDLENSIICRTKCDQYLKKRVLNLTFFYHLTKRKIQGRFKLEIPFNFTTLIVVE